jgi:hypothetical protein
VTITSKNGARTPKNATLSLKSKETPTLSLKNSKFKTKPVPQSNIPEIDLTLYISRKTLPDFQWLNNTAGNHLRAKVALTAVRQTTSTYARYLIMHNHKKKVSYTADWLEGDDEQTILETCVENINQRALAEGDHFGSLLNVPRNELLKQVVSVYNKIKKEPESIKGFTSTENPFKNTVEKLLSKFNASTSMDDGQQTVLDVNSFTNCIESLKAPLPRNFFGRIEGNDETLLARTGEKLIQNIDKLPQITAGPLSEPFTAEAQGLMEKLREDALRFKSEAEDKKQAERKEKEAGFKDKALFLAELADSKKLKMSIDDGFPSKGTYYETQHNLIISSLKKKFIDKGFIDENGVVDDEDGKRQIKILFLNSESLIPSGPEDDEVEARNPTLAAMMIRRTVVEFLENVAWFEKFGLQSTPATNPDSYDGYRLGITRNVTFHPDVNGDDIVHPEWEHIWVNGIYPSDALPHKEILQISLRQINDNEGGVQ